MPFVCFKIAVLFKYVFVFLNGRHTYILVISL